MKLSIPIASVLICGVAAAQSSAPAADPSANWGEIWKAVALPTPVINTTKGIGGIYARWDGYLYLSSDAGMFRARQTDIAANPNDVSVWQDISKGLPPGNGGNGGLKYEYVLSFGEAPDGHLLAGFGHVDTIGQNCNCSIGKFDEKTLSWSHTSTNIDQRIVRFANFFTEQEIRAAGSGSQSAAAFAHPGEAPHKGRSRGTSTTDSGTVYVVGTFNGQVYQSTDNGSSFKKIVNNFYGDHGHNTGAIFVSRFWGGRLYAGGEGPLLDADLGFKSINVNLPGDTGNGCPPYYCHNLLAAASDGDASTPPTEIVATRTDPANVSSMQRIDLKNGGAVTPVLYGTVPGYTKIFKYWTWGKIEKGTTPHEYYASGAMAGDGLCGVVGSVDGGLTWKPVGAIFNLAANCPGVATISTFNDSKYVKSNRSLYYHP